MGYGLYTGVFIFLGSGGNVQLAFFCCVWSFVSFGRKKRKMNKKGREMKEVGMEVQTDGEPI